MTVWFGVCPDKEEKNLFVLKTDKREVKVLIEEQQFDQIKTSYFDTKC